MVNKRLYRPCGGCRFRRDPKLLAARAARLAEAEAEDADAKAAAETWFEEQVKLQANSRGSSVMSIIQVVIAASDFIVGPLIGAAADAYGRKALVLIAPAVQAGFRLAVALRPSVPLFAAFQMAQVRKAPSWSRSWACFSLQPLASNLYILGQPNTFLATCIGHHQHRLRPGALPHDR